MEGQKKAYPVCMLCRVLEVSRSSFYDYVKRGSRGDVSGDAVELIAQVKTYTLRRGRAMGAVGWRSSCRTMGTRSDVTERAA